MNFPVVCRICGGRSAKLLMRTDVKLKVLKSIEHSRCLNCGAVFVSTPVSGEDLSEAYGRLNWKNYFEEMTETNKRKFSTGISYIEGILSKQYRILDIGGGDGLFANMLVDAGYKHVSVHEVPGADINPDRLDAVFQDWDYSSIPDGSFNCITLMDVFEHVPEPCKLLSACHRILRPGGYIYIHTPAVTPLDQAMHRASATRLIAGIGRAWMRGRTSIYHLQNYTAKAFEHLFSGQFEVVSFKFVNELSWPIDAYARVYVT